MYGILINMFNSSKITYVRCTVLQTVASSAIPTLRLNSKLEPIVVNWRQFRASFSLAYTTWFAWIAQNRKINVESHIRDVRFVAKKSKELHIDAPYMMDICKRTGNMQNSPLMENFIRVLNTGFRAILLKDGVTKSCTKINEFNYKFIIINAAKIKL